MSFRFAAPMPGVSILVITTMMASAAYAQQNSGPPPSGKPAMEEIVVTGYRFLEQDTSGTTNLPLPIEEVPQSISLVNNDFIRAADLKSIGEIAQYTPGALFARDEPAYGSTAKLRGFRAGYAIDGLPVGDFLVEPDAAMLERYEVVKGPSSVVYGAATPGGIINLVSKDASPDSPSYLSVLGGSRDRWRVEGQAAGALNASGTVRGIAVGVHQEADSFIDFVNMNKSTVYGGLDVDVATGLTAFVRSSYQRDRHTAFDGHSAFSDGTLPPMDRSFFIGGKDIDLTVKTARLNGGLSWQITPAWSFDLKAVYQDVRRDGGNAYVYGLQPDGSINSWAERFGYWGTKDVNVAASSVLKLDDIGLADSFISSSVRYQYFKYKLSEVFSTGTVNLFDGEDAISDHLEELYRFAGTYSLSERKLSYLTASSQAVVKVAEPVTLLGGISYSRPEVDTRFVDDSPWSNFDPGGQISYRGALTVEPVRGLNIYGSYSESFQPQERIDVHNDVLPPLTGKQYEVGAKYMSPDRTLLLTGALFHLVQSNQQVFDQHGDDGFDRYRALGQVRHQGFGLEATSKITSRWQLRGGLAFLDAKVQKDADPLIVGKKRPYLPRYTASLYSIYEFDNGLSLGAGARYVASVDTSYDGSTREIGSYTLVDGSIGYSFDNWHTQLNVKNILDDAYYVSGYESLDFLMPGEPRTVTVSLRRDF